MTTRRRNDPQGTSEAVTPDAQTGAIPGTTSPRRRTSRRKKTAAPAEPAAATSANSAHTVGISPEVRHAMIAEAAYLRAERRGFAPGKEMEDWLVAEKEIDAMLAAGHGPIPQ